MLLMIWLVAEILHKGLPQEAEEDLGVVVRKREEEEQDRNQGLNQDLNILVRREKQIKDPVKDTVERRDKISLMINNYI